MELRTLVAFAILVGAASAGPISWDDSKCAQKCSTQHQKFNYEKDQTYVYNYKSSSEVQLTDSSGDKVEVEMTATVEIGVLDDCEMILQLRDVTLSNSESSSYVVFKSALEKQPLAFAYEDGVIKSVCPSPEDKESQYVVNIKRAILSALQHSAKDLNFEETVTETDIAGICETEYKPSKSWNSVTVVKTKDLKTCSRRVNSPITTFATPYSSLDSTVKNIPLIGGEQRCEQVIGNGIVKSVKCIETDVFRPLSGKGIAVESELSLVYRETRRGVRIVSKRIGDHSTLLFASNPMVNEDNNERDARQILSELCQSTKDGVTPKTPFRIGELKEVLQGLSEDRIARIYAALESKQLCPSHIVLDIFVDSLSMAGTKGPITFMAKLVKEEKIWRSRAQAWFTMLAFNQNAEPESIRALIPFLQDPSIGGRQSLLGISAFIYNFCNDDEQKGECLDKPVVREAIAALKQQLGSSCKVSSEEEENDIVLVLMAFENIGRVGEAMDTIKQCFSEHQNSPVIRHAAIRAFRRVPCKPDIAHKMLQIFKDPSEDAEIRIYAYLGAMRCASKDIVEDVKVVLEKETINQVGAFVWSHLTNIQETSSPLKQDLKAIVADVDLQKKFSTDLRKYSRFIEWSTFSDHLNMGADAEIAIVRSPKSFLPRSGFFNMSTQLFGESVPLLEIGGHMQGMESYAERYFGDEGILSNIKIEELMKALGLGDKDSDDEENEIENKKRSARSPRKFERLQLLKERVKLHSDEEPKASAYLSVLGRKITRITSKDVSEFLSMKEAFDIMEILTQLAQKQKMERSLSVQFLDAEIVLPSLSGMKLAISVNGTATVAFKIDGKFDVRKLVTSEHSADIEGYFNPSATVEIIAIMSIDSGVHKPGLKGVFNAHSSQTIEGKVEIKQGHVVDVRIDMPKEKLELLTIKSSIYNVEKDGNEKPIVSKKYYDLEGCTKQLNKPFGIEFCGSAHIPKPLISESSPYIMALSDASLEITLQKTDEAMRGYVFHLELPPPHSHETLIYQMEIDTPGSRINRHMEVETKLTSKDEEHGVYVKMNSPFKKLQASALVAYRPNLKKFKASATIDDSKTYSLESEVQISRQGDQVQLQPTLTVSWPRTEPFMIGGKVAYNLGEKQQFSVDIQANRPKNKPSSLRGFITKDGDFSVENPAGRLRLSTDISLSSPFLESRLHGTFDKQEAVIATDISVDYKLPKTSRHTAKFVSKIQNFSTRGLTKVNTLTQMTTTQFPEENVLLKWNFVHKSMEHLENDITMVYGENLDNDENKFHLLQISKLEGVGRQARRGKSMNQIQLQAPFLENDFEAMLETEWDMIDKPKFNLKSEVKYGDSQKAEASLDYSYKSSKPLEMQIEAKLSTPSREMIYQDMLRERSPNEFEGKTMIQWQRDQRATIDYVYRLKSDMEKSHHEIELKMTSPNMRVPMQHRGLLRVTRDTLNIDSHTQYEGKPVYTVEAHLTRNGESKIEVDLNDWKGEVKFENEPAIKELSVDLKNERQNVHIEGEAKYTGKNHKHTLDVSSSWKPGDLSSQFEFSSELEKVYDKPVKYNIVSHLKLGKYYKARIEGDIASDMVQGPHQLTLGVGTKRIPSVEVQVKHEINDGNMNCEFRYLINNDEKLQVIANGKYIKQSRAMEASWGIALKSPYRNFNGKEFLISYKKDDQPNHSLNLRAQYAPSKPYNLNLEYSRDDSSSVIKGRGHILLTTPFPQYRSQEATISGVYGRKNLKLNIDVASAKGKRVQAVLDLEKQGEKASGSLEIMTPFRDYRSIKLNAEADYSDGYSSEADLEVNGEKKAEWKFLLNRDHDLSAHLVAKIVLEDAYDIKFDIISNNQKMSFGHSIRLNNVEISSSNLLFIKQGKNYNGHIQLKNGDWVGVVDMKHEYRSAYDRLLTISTRGIGRPLSLTAKLQHDGQSYIPEFSICETGSSSDCLFVKAVYKIKEKPHSHQLDREFEVKITWAPDVDIRVLLSHQQDAETLAQKVEINAWDKELGYDAILENKDGKQTAVIRVKLPSRQMLAQALLEKPDEKYIAKIELLSDEKRHPERKLVIEATHESSQQQGANVLHSTMKVSHPVFERPVGIDFQMQCREGDVLRPVEAKLELDIAADPKKKVMVQVYLEKPYKDNSNITSFINIYQIDRHDLDIMLKGHFAQRNQHVTTGYEWHWVKSAKKSHGHFFALVDKSEDEIHAYFQCPHHRMEAHGEWQYIRKQHFSLDLKTKVDDKEGKVKLAVDLSRPCGELVFTNDQGIVANRYHMCIDSEGKSLLTITAESYQGTQKQTDASVVFDRRDGKTLNAHLHWRPEVLGELIYELMQLSDQADLHIDIMTYVNHMVEQMQVIAEDFHEVVGKPFSEYAVREFRIISQELASDFEQASRALERLQSYLPTWAEIVEFFRKFIPKPIQEFFEELYQCIKKYFDSVTPISCKYGTVCYKIRYAYSRHGLEGIMEYVYSAMENMPAGYYKMALAMKDFVISKVELPALNLEPIQDAWENLIDWVVDSVEPILNAPFAKKIQNYVVEWQDYASEIADSVVANLVELYEDISSTFMETPEVQALVETVKSVIHQVLKELDNLNLGDVTRKVIDYSKDFFSREALKDSFRVITLDPENGNIQVEIRLPAEPGVIRQKLQNIRFPSKEIPFPKLNMLPMKNISKTMQSMSTAAKQEWLPPYKARGQVISGMHYKTFDNSFYDFAGQCSYLLAHDFVDKNFTVLINYAGQDNRGNIDKSIVVIIDDQVIEVDPDDETVKIDEQDTELPIFLKDVTITRRGNTILIDSRRGLSVTCNLVHDFCSTSISGWYYGKTAGLFGTYDNEPSNDYMKPKGQMESNLKAFARSWETSSGCKARNLIRDIEIDIRDPKYDRCRHLFQDDESPLSDCFEQIDEKEYLRMCARQVAVQRDPEGAACAIAAAYVDICQDAKISIALPANCSKCSSIKGELSYAEKKQYKDNPQSADIVFIIEELPCNKPIVTDIDSVARLLDRELSNSGYSNNRFGIVAFAGPEQEKFAHSHTARGKLFFSSKDVVLATEKISYNNKKGPFDAFSAVKLATDYPFRAGVSKTFILLTCSQCEESAMKIGYSRIQNLLLEHGIVLHSLSPRDIQVRGSVSKSKGIYGVDANTVFRSKDVSQSELVGTPDLRAQVAVPKDLCVALAQEVHGSFFTTKPMTESPSEIKSWKSLLARRVALSAEPHQCQQCDCRVSEDHVPITVCKPCKPLHPKRPVKSYREVEDEEDENEEE